MPATATSYRHHVGVHLILTTGEKVLLLRRANTGFADGSWSLPGGCLDEGETLPAAAAREALEEVGITIDPADLAFAHLCHHADPDGQARIGVFFTASQWTAEPVNAEPAKCSEIGWYDMSSLPADIVSYISTGLQACVRNEMFSIDSWLSHPSYPLLAGPGRRRGGPAVLQGLAPERTHCRQIRHSSPAGHSGCTLR